MKNIWLIMGGAAVLLAGAFVLLFLMPEISFHRLEKKFSHANPAARITAKYKDMSGIYGLEISGEVNDLSMFHEHPLSILGMEDCRLNFDLGQLNTWKISGLTIKNAEVTRPESFSHLSLRNTKMMFLINVRGLTDLSFLKNCSPLRYLDLHGNTNLQGFASLAEVSAETIDLSRTNIRDISPVLNPKLKKLVILNTEVGDLSPATGKGILVEHSPPVSLSPSTIPVPAPSGAPASSSPAGTPASAPATSPKPYLPPITGKDYK